MWSVLLGVMLITNVSAETTVDYRFTGISNDQKRIQLVGTLVPDKDIKMTEYNHEISFPINKNNERSEYEIPKYTPLEQKLIDSLGYEKLNKLLWGVINIEWSKYRFFDFNKKIGKYLWIQVEKKEILYANMNHSRIVMIESDKDQEVTFKLYPIPSEYYSGEYWRDSLSNHGYKYGLPDSKTLITLYDTTSEYHNIRWFFNDNITTLSDTYNQVDNYDKEFSEFNPIKIDIEKKYEKFVFNRKFPINIDWESIAMLPYYEFTVNVSKWENVLSLSYSTYQFEWENIQIR